MASKKQEIMEIASQLFREHGYKAVNLRMIAKASDIKKASLYYHFPEGKEDIFVEVHKKIFEGVKSQIDQILDSTTNFDERIDQLVNWFTAHPSMHLTSMGARDMANLSEENHQALFKSLYDNIFKPISTIFGDADATGIISVPSVEAVTGAFLAILDSFDIIPNSVDPNQKKQRLVEVINIFLTGMRRS